MAISFSMAVSVSWFAILLDCDEEFGCRSAKLVGVVVKG